MTDHPLFKHGDTPLTVLFGKQTLVKMLNAILDYPPKNTFTQTQLANQADISRKSVNTHIDIFVYFDIILEHDNGEYSMNPDSEILKKIIELEGILNTHKQKNELPDIPTEN